MTTRRNDSAPRGVKAPKARAPKPRKTADQKAARAARRTELKDAYIEYIRDTASKLNIAGRSSMTRDALINAILRAEFSPSKRKKVTKTEAKREITAQKKEMIRLQGRGPFRLIVATAQADGSLSIYGDLGPYAAARGAQVDAKTLLRRMVGDGPKLIHQGTVDDLAANTGGMTTALKKATGGVPVDGWVAVTERDDGEEEVLGAAFIVKFQAKDKKQAKIAFKAADTPTALRNNGRRSRANPRVSFKTADGRTVSFNARRNAGGGARSASRANASAVHLTDAQSREVDALYEQGRAGVDHLTREEPGAFVHWQDILIYAVGNDMNAERFVRAVQRGDAQGLFVDDRAKGRTVHASAGRKVTWADFTRAIKALQRALRR